MTKEEKEKLTTNKREKLKISQIISTNQDNKRKQNKSQSNLIRNSLTQSTKTPQ
jgi:hypothetical protein